MRDSVALTGGDLPQPIAKALRRLIRRVRTIVLLRGIAATVATAVGAILLIMGIDAFFVLFSDLTRWALTLGALAATVAAAVWFLALPMARTITLTGIARAVETHHPELQERLSSAVELLTSRDLPELRGSEVLIAALATEATNEAIRLRPRTEIPLKAARPYLFAAAGIVVVLGSLAYLYPEMTKLLLARAVLPHWNLPNVTDDMLRVTPGNIVIPEGQRLEVVVDVAHAAVKRASLRKRLPDGSETPEPMVALPATEGSERRFTLTCPPAVQSFQYRVHAGEALTQYFDVTVVPPPAVRQLDVRYDFPAYLGREPAVEANAPGDLRAVAGTVATVTANLNKPVKTSALMIDGQPAKPGMLEMLPQADGTAIARFKLPLAPKMKGRWSISLKDEYGFETVTPERLIEALPDKGPIVKLLSPPERKVRLKPTDRLPVGYAMTDDYGLGTAEFVFETDAHKFIRVPVALPPAEGGPPRAAGGETDLTLATLPLKGVRQLILRVRAVDTLPPDLRGPQEGLSRTLTIELDVAADSYATQHLKSEKENLKQALEKILQDLQKAKQDSVPLKQDVGKAPDLKPEQAERVDRMRNLLADARATVSDVQKRTAESTFAGLEPKVEKLEQEVDNANDKTGQVKLADAAPDRTKAADEADKHVDKAIEQAKQLLQDVEKAAQAAQLAQDLKDLADRQADLAQKKADAEQPSAEWQKDQGDLAKDVAELVKETPPALAAQLAQDMAKAKDLAAEARKLERQEQALARDTAALERLSPLEQAKKDLAAEQAKLAQEAKSEPVAADQAKPMNAAAKDIEKGDLNKAVEEQKAAENALANRAAGKENMPQPETQKPDGQKPEGQKADGQKKPEGQKADGQKPEGQKADGQKPEGQKADGQKPEGQKADGQKPEGQKADGQKPEGQKADGQKPEGQKADGQKPEGQPAAKPSPEQAQKAANLAAKQSDLRKKTEALAAQQAKLAAPITSDQANRLQIAQAQVAREATELAEKVAPVAEPAKEMGEKAAAAAQKAAASLPSNIPQAAQNADKAAEALDALAKDMAKRATETPEGDKPAGEKPAGEKPAAQPQSAAGDMAAKAADLAERQKDLAKEMAALTAGSPQQALAAEQANVAADTADLKQEAADLAKRAQDLAPQTPAGQQASQAANSLNQAQQAEGQAQQAMATPQPQAAVPAQKAAAQDLGNAAQALSQTAQTLAQAAKEAEKAQAAAQATPAQAEMGSQMAEANTASAEAAAKQSPSAAAQAAQALAQAAKAAQAAAMAAGAMPGQKPSDALSGMPAPAGQSKDPKKGTSSQAASQTAAKLESLGIKLSDWARLPGELRNQILQAADEAGPEEYRQLIKRYFQEVAKRGSTSRESEQQP